jgi:hypothetical protein
MAGVEVEDPDLSTLGLTLASTQGLVEEVADAGVTPLVVEDGEAVGILALSTLAMGALVAVIKLATIVDGMMEGEVEEDGRREAAGFVNNKFLLVRKVSVAYQLELRSVDQTWGQRMQLAAVHSRRIQ